jgi:hypothetical protein
VAVPENVTVAFDTIEWEVGVNLDPEFVYNKCRKALEYDKEQTTA